MSPGAVNMISVNTSPVKQLKPNYKFLSPSNYFSKTKQYFPEVDLQQKFIADTCLIAFNMCVLASL